MIEPSDLRSPLPDGDPNLPPGVDGTPPLVGAIGDDFIWWVTNNLTGITYGATTRQVRATFVTDTNALPRVRFVNPATGARLPAGSQFILQVTATDAVGIAQVEFFLNGGSIGLGVAVDNDYSLPFTMPLTGNTITITAKATNVSGKTASVTCILFIGATATDPQAPSFADFVDDAAGGSLRLVVEPGIPMSDYRYFITDTGTPTVAPSTGIISVGNVAGRVFAYSVASGSRNQSPTAASQYFTTAEQLPIVTFVAPVNGTTIIEGTTVLLRVTAVEPRGRNISSVRFYNGPTLIGNAAIQNATLWQLPYTIPGSTATINLRAEAISEDDAVGNASSFVFVTPAAPVFTVPSVPGKPSAVAGNALAVVTWAAPASNGGATITGYNLYANGAGAPFATNVQSPYTHNGLTNGTAYTYEAQAHNSVGDGPKSPASDAVTPAAPALPVYANTFNLANQTGDGMSFVSPGAESLHLTARTGTSGPTISVQLISAGTTSYVDYASEYVGDGYYFLNANGVRFDRTFPAADTIINF